MNIGWLQIWPMEGIGDGKDEPGVGGLICVLG